MESIVKDNILDHIRNYGLIKVSHHGFVKNRSCLTNFLEFLEIVTNYIDHGYPIDVIYLDFQNSFDRVLHKRLTMKTDAFGITGQVFKWIEN
jgi:hypothetical protein